MFTHYYSYTAPWVLGIAVFLQYLGGIPLKGQFYCAPVQLYTKGME